MKTNKTTTKRGLEMKTNKTTKTETKMTVETKNYINKINKIVGDIEKKKVDLFNTFVAAYQNLKTNDFDKFYKAIELEGSTKRKMRGICKNEILIKNIKTLPKKWSVLYELKKIDDEKLVELIDTKKINNKTTIKEAKKMVDEFKLVKSKTDNNSGTGNLLVVESFSLRIKLDRDIEDFKNNEEVKNALSVLEKYYDIENLFE